MSSAIQPLEAARAEDYAAIGLCVGLEVHQQLATATKLFCRCPIVRYRDDYDAEVLRHMRPTLSELGEYDPAALMEQRTRKRIFYRIHHTSACTYEFDDNPPFRMSEEALDAALQIAQLLGSLVVDELHVARKQCLDGSYPSGFQRSALLALGGAVPLARGSAAIAQVALEEDSCRKIDDHGHDRHFFTDRLGIPLVEIVSEPMACTPWQAAELGQRIRRLTRATPAVRSGIGAARQDVNVSIAGGTRVEIKGLAQLSRLPRVVHNEAQRQLALLRLRAALVAAGADEHRFAGRCCELTSACGRVAQRAIRESLAGGGAVFGAVLPGFEGLLRTFTQPDTTFAQELIERARTIASLADAECVIHSDSGPETLTAREWQQLRRRADAPPGSALVLVWGPREDARVAAEEIIVRAREACAGVPPESRRALPGGTSAFERLLPARNRIYPETDLPPEPMPRERIARVAAGLPANPLLIERKMVAAGLDALSAETLAGVRGAHAVVAMLERRGAEAARWARRAAQELRAGGRGGRAWRRTDGATIAATVERLVDDADGRGAALLELRRAARLRQED